MVSASIASQSYGREGKITPNGKDDRGLDIADCTGIPGLREREFDTEVKVCGVEAADCPEYVDNVLGAENEICEKNEAGDWIAVPRLLDVSGLLDKILEIEAEICRTDEAAGWLGVPELLGITLEAKAETCEREEAAPCPGILE